MTATVFCPVHDPAIVAGVLADARASIVGVEEVAGVDFNAEIFHVLIADLAALLLDMHPVLIDGDEGTFLMYAQKSPPEFAAEI